MELKKLFRSKTSTRILWVIVGLIAALFVFQAGIHVGYRKAQFGMRFGDHFHADFFGPRRTPMRDAFMPIPGGHGASGKVVSISLPLITVATPDNLEKEILVSTSTIIRRFRSSVTAADLKTEDFIVALGSPNSNGQIEAKLIRIVPAASSTPK